jgi:hypothetical protein
MIFLKTKDILICLFRDFITNKKQKTFFDSVLEIMFDNILRNVENFAF